MRKAILIVLLAVVSSSAAAEWVVMGTNYELTAYADPVTIRRTGDMVRMWELLDYKTAKVTAGGKPFLSAKPQMEYDCKEERVRILNASFHSGNKGGGIVVVRHSEPGNWEPVPPDSLLAVVWKFACGQR